MCVAMTWQLFCRPSANSTSDPDTSRYVSLCCSACSVLSCYVLEVSCDFLIRFYLSDEQRRDNIFVLSISFVRHSTMVTPTS